MRRAIAEFASYLKPNGPRILLGLILVSAIACGFLPPEAIAAGFILNFETVAGSTLACTATVPATFDAAGYGATAMVYVNIGEITDLGSGLGRKYNTVSHSPIASAQVIKRKGGYELATLDIMLAWDQADSGQDLLRTASDSNVAATSILSFKLTKQGGDIRYFTAQVSEFTENFGTVDKVVQGKVSLLLQRDVVDSPA